MNENLETQKNTELTKSSENQNEFVDLTIKNETKISIKFEPKFFDSLHFYLSKHFLLKAIPSTAFTFLAVIGFVFMFLRGIDPKIVWSAIGLVAFTFIVAKPIFEFIMIKIKSQEENSCEIYGDTNKIILRTPLKEKMYKYDYLQQIIETKHGMIFKFGQIRYFYLPSRLYQNNPDFDTYYKYLEKNYFV